MDLLDPLKISGYGGQSVTVAQVKFDGYYLEVYKEHFGSIITCLKGQKSNNWSKLTKNWNINYLVSDLPNETILRCELHAIDVPATSIPTLINEADERLLISPFRIELWNGLIPTTGFLDEQRLLSERGFCVPQVKVLHGDPCSLSTLAYDNLIELAEETNIEGWVVKDYPRGGAWKIKPLKTVDAFVSGYEISDSDTYIGGLKSIEISVCGVTPFDKDIVIGNIGSGFEGDYRMSVDPETLIGRVGEFKYQDIGAKGKLKFARFIRWRDDEKKASECIIDQLKGFQYASAG